MQLITCLIVLFIAFQLNDIKYLLSSIKETSAPKDAYCITHQAAAR